MAPMLVNAVIQARLSSSRLPGKVLEPLGNASVLSWVVDAARRAPGIAEVIVATSTSADDDAVAAEADACAAPVVRGPLDDVLERYRLAIEKFPCDAVVRLTADCPLLDPRLIGQVVALWRSDPSLDYVSNVLTRTYPRGLDTELVRAEVLNTVEASGSDRIHVTSAVYHAPERYRCAGVHGGRDDSDLRVTVDTAEDYAVVQAIVDELGSSSSDVRAVVDFLRSRPDIAQGNSVVPQKPLAAG
ncbi:cytidylyltransferase domain-containing protein [Sciscionella marina]|uniref:cytidylyltransferase domain-containing protein n=1 Tax=Sciscionella marina TaxID=508770 RepID=UPI00035F6C70